MASHKDIHVGDTNWVIRVGGEDVRVKVLEKSQKASGRGYEFRCKRIGNDNRVVGRNVTRGSGAFRPPGVAPKATGFSKGAKPPRRKPASRAAAPRPAPRAAPRPAVHQNPPASAFFSEVQEPGTPRSSPGPANGRSSASRLGSLRGRGRASSATTSPARPTTADGTTPAKARREIEKQLKHADLSPLVTELVKDLIRSDGTEYQAQQVYGRVLANHRMRSFGVPFRR